MASSSSSGSKSSWNYHVFLSFRGPDTRNTFTGHLFQALHGKGINVFIDNDLKRGEIITSELLEVIEESRISIVILSESYASSPFCLDELVKILDCRESKWQFVIPVFYHVDPTDVEEQRGTFGQNFATLEAQLNKPKIDDDLNYWKFIPAMAVNFFRYFPKRIGMNEENEGERVQDWRKALSTVATLSGFHLKKGDHENTIVQSIVRSVLKQLNCTPIYVAKHPIGLDIRINHILEKLNMELDDVRMLGLYGMGGIGKTTIAKALYNTCIARFQFDGSCFLLNVRERSKKDGFAQLQEAILFEILRDEKRLFGNFDVGIELIKERLCGKKVLIVIDDVDSSEQLEKLAGGFEWFGRGSRIIITTRDLRLLEEHGVTMVYEVQKLKDSKAMELFIWHAFKEVKPSEIYMELSRLVVGYAQGHPLTLEVLGSSLYGRNEVEWKDELEKIKRYPNKKIIDVLKVSYDGLDCEEKIIFLYIAVFFNGTEKDEVTEFLKACGLSAHISVQRLIEKSLVYNQQESLKVHDLLVEMGTKIALKDSFLSRIQKQEDIRIFFENKRACNVQILQLDFDGEEEVPLNFFLESSTKLRILIIRKGNFTKIPKKLPENIKWLEWGNRSFSVELLPTGLIYLFSKGGSINNPLSKVQKFITLSNLDFKSCKYLKKTVDFSSIPNLKTLILWSCKNLEKMNFIGDKVERLHVDGCSKLENLPLLPISLEFLSLMGSGIKEIPPYVGNMVHLRKIYATGCKNLISVPINIFSLPRLLGLFFNDCPNLTISQPPESPVFPSTPINPEAAIFLWGSKFVSLPSNIFKFSPIFALHLVDCEWLVEIPELPRCLRRLHAQNCKSLVKFSQNQFQFFEGDLGNCHKLAVEDEMKSFREMLENEEQVESFRKMVEDEEQVYPWWIYDIILPGNEILEWFRHVIECDGDEVSFKLPPSVSLDNLIGIAWGAVFQPKLERFNLSFEYWNGGFKRSCGLNLESEHVWLSVAGVHLSELQAEELFKFYCEPKDGAAFKMCGVHLLYKQ